MSHRRGRSRDGIVVFRFEDPLIGPEGCFSAEIRVGGQVLRLFDTCDMSTYFGVGPPGSAFCSESTERLRPGHSAKKSGG